jgi:hypothetical protein
MAVTRLSDIIEPSLFTQYVAQKTTELSAFFASGVVQTSDQLNELTKAASTIFSIPYWNALASTEPNVSSDDPAVNSTPLNIAADKQIGVKQRRNQSWSAMDLVANVAGSDPMQQIVNGVAGYWSRVLNKNLVQITRGLYLDNVGANGSDMVNDISDDAAGAPAAGTLISAAAIQATWANMGDASGDLVAIAMHSKCYHRLQALDLIVYQQYSGQSLMFPTYLGKRVIVDDACFKDTAPTNQDWYTTVLFGQGAIGYGEGAPNVPTEVIRVPSAGNGEGQETLFSRKHFCLHPAGYQWVSGSMAGNTPTNAELALATNWTRKFDRKNVPIAFLVSNG